MKVTGSVPVGKAGRTRHAVCNDSSLPERSWENSNWVHVQEIHTGYNHKVKEFLSFCMSTEVVELVDIVQGCLNIIVAATVFTSMAMLYSIVVRFLL